MEALGHDWKDATCTEPQTCTVCNATDGKALGHDWKDATCKEPKTCTVCGETEGEVLEHKVEEWKVTKEATCTEEGQQSGKCTLCGDTIDKKLEKAEHTSSDWVVTQPATVDAKGERAKSCTVCGEVLKTEKYEMSSEEKEAAFKAECQAYSYDQIARDPEGYSMTKGVYTGKVVQVIESGNSVELRVNVTQTSYSYKDTIYVKYTLKEGQNRILEDDIVTIWGYNSKTISYTTVMGATVTIPYVKAEYLSLS